MYVPSQATKDESVSGETNVTTRPVAGSAWRSPYLSRKYSFPLQPVKVVAASRNASDPTPSGLAGLTIRPARKVDFNEGVTPSEAGGAGAPDPGSDPAGLNSSALAEPAPPAANILFVFRRTLAKRSRRSFIKSTVVHVPVAGSNDSVLSKGSPKVDDGLPPMTRTFPSRRTTVVCQTRLSAIEPVFAQLPVAGSKISAVRPPPPPPATTPLPLGSSVAECPSLAFCIEGMRIQFLVEGSYSSAVAATLPVTPPVTRTFPLANSVAVTATTRGKESRWGPTATCRI